MPEKGEVASTRANEIISSESECKDGKLGLPSPLVKPPKCPECNSQRVWKDGPRRTKHGNVQRWLCRDCGYRFSQNHSAKPFYTPSSIGSSCQIGATREAHGQVKNLAKVKSVKNRLEARQATKVEDAEIKGKIIEYGWYLKKQGRADSTIRTYTEYVKLLWKKGADIFDLESVKWTIAEGFKDRNTKRIVTNVYDAFVKFMGQTWEKPTYKHEHKPTFIPTQQELQNAVNCGQKESVAFSKLLYETGARCNEAERLEWTDIDAERSQVTIKASKNSNARVITVPRQLIETLLNLPRLDDVRVFPPRAEGTRRVLFRLRMKTLARKHNNKRYLKIHPHTFRYCKALRECRKYKGNAKHVQRILGHRSLVATERYLALYNEIYGELQPEDYVCELASTVKEAKKLVEAGFEFVCEIDGKQLFRKAK